MTIQSMDALRDAVAPRAMSLHVRRNVLANLLGGIWNAALTILFIPLYIHFIGIEAYGLIGLMITMQALLAAVDTTLATTLNREAARTDGLDGAAADRLRNTARTLEFTYWSIAIVVWASLLLVSPWLAQHWVTAEKLPPETVRRAFLIIASVLAIHLPSGLYMGGLMGLQRQVLLNIVLGTWIAARTAVTLLVLWKISPSIEAFLLVQLAGAAIRTILLGAIMWRLFPRGSGRPRFALSELGRIRNFAAGMGGITLAALALTQSDKLILSRLLSLEDYGYYMVGATVALSLSRITGPIFNAIFPRFSQLVAEDSKQSLTALYHKSAQALAVLLIPTAIAIAMFAQEALWVWSGDTAIALNSSAVAAALTLGSALNGLMHVPFALQLAYGWTNLALYSNIAAVVAYIPLTVLAVQRVGAVGAAWVWIALNTAYLTVQVPIMHRRLLVGELQRFYVQDLLRPTLAIVALLLPIRFFVSLPAGRGALFIALCLIGITALVVAALTSELAPAAIQALRRSWRTHK